MSKIPFLAIVLTIACSHLLAQEDQDGNDAPPELGNDAPPELDVQGATDSKDGSEQVFGKITLGTRRREVHRLLGRPTFESIIPSLRRRVDQFPDGTEVTFVESKAISVRPSSSATRDPKGNFFVKRESTTATISPVVVRQCGIHCEDKCRIEESFWYRSPVIIPTLYNGIPFTPPMFDSSMIGAYLRGCYHCDIQSESGCDHCRCDQRSQPERSHPVDHSHHPGPSVQDVRTPLVDPER